MEKGIDTSKWQNGKVDYTAAKRAGYTFVILRIGAGNGKDTRFEADYLNAKRAGLKVGVYIYTYATTVEGAKKDAQNVLKWLNGKELDLPVAYDVEDAKQKGTARKGTNSAMYNAFAQIIKKAKYDCMLYSGEYFYNNYFNKAAVTDKLWIAKYSKTKPSVGRDIYMWQYTSDAIKNDFYKADLDRNYLYEQNPVQTPKVSYLPQYKGTSASIVVALNSLGIISTYAYRKQIAAKNNIAGYSGTATQNTMMLNLLKQGKLIKP